MPAHDSLGAADERGVVDPAGERSAVLLDCRLECVAWDCSGDLRTGGLSGAGFKC